MSSYYVTWEHQRLMRLWSQQEVVLRLLSRGFAITLDAYQEFEAMYLPYDHGVRRALTQLYDDIPPVVNLVST